jgi:acyl-CoA dehydrogenase
MTQAETLEEFRLATRAWLEANCPPEMREPLASDADRCLGGRHWKFACEAQRVWLQRMAAKGWTAPHWPREYGGAGLDWDHVKVLREEMARLNCRPPVEPTGQGMAMLGETLLAMGTEEQKREHLPKIASGEVRWCQGYSEPGAGSDLASLQTRAEDRGDHFVVNGRKIWTSGADVSDWMFMLVRTDPQAPKHAGISMLLVDMGSPGIEVKPIRMITGWSKFCETFLDDVVVPKRNLLGGLNEGWAVSRRLLMHEREAMSVARDLVALPSLGHDALAARGESGRLADDALRADIAAYEVDIWAFSALLEHSRDLVAAGKGDAAFASVVKTERAELDQRRLELAMAIGGSDLLEVQGPRTEDGQTARAWLHSKCYTIASGTTEVLLNVIAKRILNLPGA